MRQIDEQADSNAFVSSYVLSWLGIQDAYMYLAAGNKTSQMGPAMTATSQSLLTQENSDMTQVCTTMLSHDLILNWALQGR